MTENNNASMNLDFERTLPISLVHKPSNDSVLLTDYVAISPDETILGAQIPRSHGLYQENILESRGYDIAALVEICRQACFAIAHNQFGLSLAENRYQFLFRELKVTVNPEALDIRHPIGRFIRVIVNSKVEKETRNAGRTAGLQWRYVLTDPTSSTEIAVIQIRQNFVDRVQWKRIRVDMCKQRGVQFQAPIEVPEDSELKPAEVARWNPQNIALLRVTHKDGGYIALARFDPRHPVLFDRPTADHIFAMTQLEASRQLAIYATAKIKNIDAFRLKIIKCDALFISMCELNTPTELHAKLSKNEQNSCVMTVSIQLIQSGRTVSDFSIDVQEII
ncbi:AfsA-related hotdog domain-containing protein [Xenorhabdus bharatensis]|uniref:AfsA-related hotdog domain-containing protein n=1 Tax=Xenorhabdus bharatensis TaxID=3136256 RepID=UPI0030F3CC31